ncbi:hypothetical protein DFP73DRAFT_599707 [Morchella snyderi]|nr:hypothetical protein DFP73DRAFT_599707 [Morchella snyderi]
MEKQGRKRETEQETGNEAKETGNRDKEIPRRDQTGVGPVRRYKQAQLRPLAPSCLSLLPAPPPPTKAKSIIEEPALVEQTPLPETPIPADTHLDEEVTILIAEQNSLQIRNNQRKLDDCNKVRRGFEMMGIEQWSWFCKEETGTNNKNILIGRKGVRSYYSVTARIGGNTCTTNEGSIKAEDRAEIAKYDGMYLAGRWEGPGGERERIKIVIESV